MIRTRPFTVFLFAVGWLSGCSHARFANADRQVAGREGFAEEAGLSRPLIERESTVTDGSGRASTLSVQEDGRIVVRYCDRVLCSYRVVDKLSDRALKELRRRISKVQLVPLADLTPTPVCQSKAQEEVSIVTIDGTSLRWSELPCGRIRESESGEGRKLASWIDRLTGKFQEEEAKRIRDLRSDRTASRGHRGLGPSE